MSASEIVVTPVRNPWSEYVVNKLVQALSAMPDVAFAHLVDAGVPGQGEVHTALFVWLHPGALRSLRRVLNQVSAIVSGALPDGMAVDIIILNSAPELLEQVEAVGGLIVESDPEERRRALEAAAAEPAGGEGDGLRVGPWWWPF
ncbi:MAG: hypothetical protein DRJ61_09605 [Acidobacteria bacterium]|nr:MAG: hypothetical protein DRJ61_09605 [Acidobacteriota bacterium]